MTVTRATTTAIKSMHRSRIYHQIYEMRVVSKQLLAQNLQLGLSTVTQNLKALEEERLIERSGQFDSTGGRKARAIRIVRDARISIGVSILQEMANLVAVDLYGEVIYQDTVIYPFTKDEQYCEMLTKKLEDFISSMHLERERILGVAIAVPGIILDDGCSASLGIKKHMDPMSLSPFLEKIPYPCFLERSSRAAAYLELWHRPDLENALILLLNRYVSGALITNRIVQRGRMGYSGSIQHMRVLREGDECYCGNHGCLDTCCSARSLEQFSGLEIPEFFQKLRQQDEDCMRIWEQYLEDLSNAILAVSMVLDSEVILSGYLVRFMTQEDVEKLEKKVIQKSPFLLEPSFVRISNHAIQTPAMGAALYYINQYLQTI